MIEIYPYAQKHAEGVVSVILSIQQSEFGIPITLEAQPDLKNIPDFYQVKGGNFWVAMDGDSVVGTIGLLDIGNGQAALRKMFVALSPRRRARSCAATACKAHGVGINPWYNRTLPGYHGQILGRT